LARLNEIEKLSPTAINQYIKCPLQFFYMRIAGIEEPEMTDEEDVDNRIFGNIFHRSAELIYKRLWVDKKEITKDSIQEFLKHPEQLEMIVDQAFREELFGIRNNAYLPEYNGLQLINREVIIRYLRQLLKIDARHSHFNIMGLELYVSENITIETSQGKRTVQVGGIIDRLDMIHDEQGNERIRVLDYKTGKVPRSATQSIDELFSNENISKKHTDYFFQTMLYSIIVGNSEKINPRHIPVSPALLFIQQSGGENYDPILSINKEKIEDAKQYEAEFRENLQNVITEIFEPQVPFQPTENKDICVNCIYKQLCNM
ncbi:MAG: PD-(D/E)XK nuclease family protein, partial [Prevotella sp.]|nr:PD-(D/E)XK nuclease family protein [Prevotella sp.]